MSAASGRLIRPLLAALGVGGVAALGVLTGPEVRTRSLYILPVLFAAWSDGALAGETVALAACGAWLFTHLVIHDGRFDVVGPPLLSAAIFLAALVAVSVMAARVRRAAAVGLARARRREKLMSIASHEVGNALMVLEGTALLLRERLGPGDPRTEEWLEMLQRAVRRVRSVDQRLLRRGASRPALRRRPAPATPSRP
jgi:signal transduction histidine kinase